MTDGSSQPPGDPIADAIKKTEEIPLAAVNVTISSTGRIVSLQLPPDLTDAELLEFVGWVGTSLRQASAANRAAKENPASRLVVARGNLPPAPGRPT